MLEIIKEKVIDELNERIGQTVYLCDLGMELSESENVNGSWYCSRYKAEEEVKANFDTCGKFVEWHKMNFGETLNPFDDVEKFHCIMMVFAVEGAFSSALNNTEYSDLWNEKVEITEEFAKAIETALNDVEMEDIF